MPIKTQCQACKSKFTAPDKLIGKRVKCPKCSAMIDVGVVAEPVISRGTGTPAKKRVDATSQPTTPEKDKQGASPAQAFVSFKIKQKDLTGRDYPATLCLDLNEMRVSGEKLPEEIVQPREDALKFIDFRGKTLLTLKTQRPFFWLFRSQGTPLQFRIDKEQHSTIKDWLVTSHATMRELLADQNFNFAIRVIAVFGLVTLAITGRWIFVSSPSTEDVAWLCLSVFFTGLGALVFLFRKSRVTSYVAGISCLAMGLLGLLYLVPAAFLAINRNIILQIGIAVFLLIHAGNLFLMARLDQKAEEWERTGHPFTKLLQDRANS